MGEEWTDTGCEVPSATVKGYLKATQTSFHSCVQRAFTERLPCPRHWARHQKGPSPWDMVPALKGHLGNVSRQSDLMSDLRRGFKGERQHHVSPCSQTGPAVWVWDGYRSMDKYLVWSLLKATGKLLKQAVQGVWVAERGMAEEGGRTGWGWGGEGFSM